ncbi:MAG: TlpA family protein disulfide reductase, partial [Muribaculaceae bacterium]|nr:TlpA family protein disulfide reductase [Muribaculaceae bacterium]
MKKLILFAATGIVMAACASDKGSVTIKLPADYSEKTLVVSHVLIDNQFSATSADDLKVYYDTLDVKNGTATLRLDRAGAARYDIEPPVMTRSQPEFYATPDESLDIVIKSFDPLECEMKGSRLMEDYTSYEKMLRPYQQEYMDLVSRSNEDMTEDQVNELRQKAQDLYDRRDNAVKKFVADNPDSPIVPYVIIDLSGDDFKAIYDNMTPEAKKSILMPFAEAYNKDVEQMLADKEAEEARRAEVASGKIEAPGFTLPDLAGKKVSLSDFRGKWVVLDFWGSWCGWCIKGFPALKEAYRKYGDKLVVIGIDCNESETDWREGVKKHEIPWLNLYNG